MATDNYILTTPLLALRNQLRYLRRDAEVGIVYCIAQPSAPEIVKIGKTRFSTQQRLGNLNTAVAEDYEVVWDVVCYRHSEVEKILHFHFAAERISPSKEFFRVDRKRLEIARRVVARYMQIPKDVPGRMMRRPMSVET